MMILVAFELQGLQRVWTRRKGKVPYFPVACGSKMKIQVLCFLGNEGQ